MPEHRPVGVLAIATLVLLAAAALATARAHAPGPTSTTNEPYMDTTRLNPKVAEYLTARAAEFSQINPERRADLQRISDYIARQVQTQQHVRLNFVCTHNSRRSHMSQLFAAAAAHAYDLPITTYSGGTEDTAFNPRAVAAMQRAGFHIDQTTNDPNPIYHVRFAASAMPVTCFSKAYDNPPNPKAGFAAVMVCTEADQACPAVPGANARFALPFIDPKVADNTPAEADTYDQRARQIAREMLYIMANAAE